MSARGFRRWAASAVILAVGYAAAAPFGRTSRPDDADLLNDEQVALHLLDSSLPDGGSHYTATRGHMLDPERPAQPVVVEKSRAQSTAPQARQLSEIPTPPPPALQDQFPDAPPDLPRASMSRGSRPALRQDAAEARLPAPSVRTYRIRDGDTLKRLAERFLHDPSRHLELYEANRDLLPSPEILPLDVEIVIPAAPQPRGPRPHNPLPHGGLAPVT